MQSNQIFRRINFCLDDKIYYNFIYFFFYSFSVFIYFVAFNRFVFKVNIL